MMKILFEWTNLLIDDQHEFQNCTLKVPLLVNVNLSADGALTKITTLKVYDPGETFEKIVYNWQKLTLTPYKDGVKIGEFQLDVNFGRQVG